MLSVGSGAARHWRARLRMATGRAEDFLFWRVFLEPTSLGYVPYFTEAPADDRECTREQMIGYVRYARYAHQ